MKRTHYLIEFRFFGSAKYDLRTLIYEIDSRLRLRQTKRRRPVPHISFVGPFTTKSQRRLVSDFKELCSKQPLMEFKINGFGTFMDSRVVYINIDPDKNLDSFRWELSKKLRGYCNLNKTDLDRRFWFHATIAMKLNQEQFRNVKKYVSKKKSPEFKHYLMRVALIKNQKILYEYDFFLKRLLSREEALSKTILSKTFKRLKRYMKIKPVPIKEERHRGFFSKLQDIFRLLVL